MSIAERLALAPELRDTQAWSAPEESSLGRRIALYTCPESVRSVRISKELPFRAFRRATDIRKCRCTGWWDGAWNHDRMGRCLVSMRSSLE